MYEKWMLSRCGFRFVVFCRNQSDAERVAEYYDAEVVGKVR
jgi:hypothetical protein